MPHATATFNGQVIAETDTWENVEGNIYVRMNTLYPRMTILTEKVPSRLRQPVDADRYKYPHALPMERRSFLLSNYGQWYEMADCFQKDGF